ncbi:MAG: PEP-CTERM sorting domain-containing protein [Paracoccaceae bacterium]|nr:PEP-CTERM sorting domain-containing protein [Paracoccaceae bacterium]
MNRFAGALALCCSSVTGSAVALTIDAVETGSDVIFTFSGDIDLTGLVDDGVGPTIPGVTPNIGEMVFVPERQDLQFYNLSTAPNPNVFGSGGTSPLPTSVTGDLFEITPLSLSGAPAALGVATTFTGGPISGSMTFAGSSFSSLGLTEGTYVWTSVNDTFTLNIGDDGATVIPLPATLPLALAGLGLLALVRRRG